MLQIYWFRLIFLNFLKRQSYLIILIFFLFYRYWRNKAAHQIFANFNLTFQLSRLLKTTWSFNQSTFCQLSMDIIKTSELPLNLTIPKSEHTEDDKKGFLNYKQLVLLLIIIMNNFSIFYYIILSLSLVFTILKIMLIDRNFKTRKKRKYKSQ